MNPKRVAVLLCAYNSDETLQEAASSVLQSELVTLFIIDDGSDTPVSKYLTKHDSQIIIRLQKNLGLIGALNYGLDYILSHHDYDYIARMDADDICHSERFPKQLKFMDANPNIGLVGAWAQCIDENTQEALYSYTPPARHEDILKELYYNSCILHPLFMLRASLLRQSNYRYSSKYFAAEDYELIRRLALQTRLANIPEILLDYRISINGISVSRRKRQLITRLKIQLEYGNVLSADFYIGIAKTLLLFLVPASLIAKLKARKN